MTINVTQYATAYIGINMVNKPLKFSSRYPNEVDTKIKEYEKRGYKLKNRGVFRNDRGAADQIKHWAVMIRE
jgi:hypothetical protein